MSDDRYDGPSDTDAPDASDPEDVGEPVGRGRPPKQHRFKAGNKAAAGRRARTPAKKAAGPEELLQRPVPIGKDARGRAIKKPIGEVIDMQLMNKAASGDLKAIKILLDYKLKAASRTLCDCQREKTPAELEAARAELKERQALSAKLVGMLQFLAVHKKSHVLAQSGDIRLAPWLLEAIADYREKHGASRNFGMGDNLDPHFKPDAEPEW